MEPIELKKRGYTSCTHKYIEKESIILGACSLRKYKGRMKYSHRLYVDGLRLIAKNLKTLLVQNRFDKHPMYDMSIYDSTKFLSLLLTTLKTDGSKIPPLTPVDCEIFDCCASYLKEDFEDWD